MPTNFSSYVRTALRSSNELRHGWSVGRSSGHQRTDDTLVTSPVNVSIILNRRWFLISNIEKCYYISSNMRVLINPFSVSKLSLFFLVILVFCLAQKMVSKQRVVVLMLSVKVIHIYHKFINILTSYEHYSFTSLIYGSICSHHTLRAITLTVHSR